MTAKRHSGMSPAQANATKGRHVLIHYRNPEGNERSLCNAEERAIYCGDTIIATAVLAEVTCVECRAKEAAQAKEAR